MANQTRFEGLEVTGLEYEITGGGTHETETHIGPGDEGTALIHWKCVNVKHPMKGGEIVRVQTLNVTSSEDPKVTEKYKPEPKAEQSELASV